MSAPTVGTMPPWCGLALRAAAELLLEEWKDRGIAGVPPAQVARTIRQVTDAVGDLLRADRFDVRSLPVSGLLGGLIDRLEGAFVDTVARRGAEVPARELLRAFDGFRRLRELLAADVAAGFTGRLDGPEAGQLVVELAHDMRSSLGSVLFLSDHLRQATRGAVPDSTLRQLGLIYSATFALSAMVDDVVELARGGVRLFERAPVPLDLVAIVEQVRGMLLPVAEERNVELVCVAPPPATRLGHPAALHRVLLNLATNALKFTDRGTVHVEVRPIASSVVRVAVRDTGRGIPAEMVGAIMQPFRPTEARPDGEFSSSGLGLAMCQRLLTMMGSALQVDTEIGRGTEFSFELDLPFASTL